MTVLFVAGFVGDVTKLSPEPMEALRMGALSLRVNSSARVGGTLSLRAAVVGQDIIIVGFEHGDA